MDAERYYPLVTEAIRRAETLQDLGAPGARDAFLDVSLLEEKIAGSLPVSDPEGAVARRGAVRAALSAEDLGRARRLIERFLAEDDVGHELRGELHQLAKQAERLSADQGSSRAIEDAAKHIERARQLIETFVTRDAVEIVDNESAEHWWEEAEEPFGSRLPVETSEVREPVVPYDDQQAEVAELMQSIGRLNLLVRAYRRSHRS